LKIVYGFGFQVVTLFSQKTQNSSHIEMKVKTWLTAFCIRVHTYFLQQNTMLKERVEKMDNNIIEEMKNIEQEIRSSDNPAFIKSTYWHQQAANIEASNQEAVLKEILDHLQQLETKMVQMEALLIKQNPSCDKRLGY